MFCLPTLTQLVTSNSFFWCIAALCCPSTSSSIQETHINKICVISDCVRYWQCNHWEEISKSHPLTPGFCQGSWYTSLTNDRHISDVSVMHTAFKICSWTIIIISKSFFFGIIRCYFLNSQGLRISSLFQVFFLRLNEYPKLKKLTLGYKLSKRSSVGFLYNVAY